MTQSTRKIWTASLCILLIMTGVHGQNVYTPEEDEAITLIRQIYDEVSSDGSTPVDWDLVRSFFLEEAVIVLRSSARDHTIFTLDGFIQDFRDFYENPVVQESGFREEIVRIKPQIYRDAASIGVVYEASIPGSERPPQKGIDFWILINMDNQWKVVGISNEIIPPDQEFPEFFQ
jgi:hypothetical protein